MDSLTRFLLRHGMTVLRVYNGADCLGIVRGHTVDVILLERMMPDMDVLAVLKLRQISPFMPIIRMTTRAAAWDLKMAAWDLKLKMTCGWQLGCSESVFVVKPDNHADLLRRIQNIVSGYRELEEEARASAAIDPTKPPAT